MLKRSKTLILFILCSIYTQLNFTNVLKAQVPVELAIEQANQQLWDKFIDKYGVVNDFVGERPTPFDCRLSRPNAFGWWTPIEDGAFFTGLYLIAACDRAKATKSKTDEDKARILAQGLLRLGMVSDVPGFIARGVSTDGETHYPNGSNDQTIPWVYGLLYYLDSDVPSEKEKNLIKKKIAEVISALQTNKWRFPSDGMFTGKFRDDLRDNRFLEVPCYLFLLRAMYELTEERKWLSWYREALDEKPDGSEKTRAQICATGISYDLEMWSKSKTFLWIYVMKQAALVQLSEWEEDKSMKSLFKTGIKNNRDFALEFAKKYSQFDNNDGKVFGNSDWRACYTEWFPQFTIEEGIAISRIKNDSIIGQRKSYERELMTTPLAAASIIALASNISDSILLDKIISHYDYSKLFLSEFLYAEFAYYKIRR